MTEPSAADTAGIWHPRHLWVTVGVVALIFLEATQALAVTTVMPLVSADLDGAQLYAVAFSGTLATSVVGMVAVGAWCDRAGPVAPLATAVGVFVAGLAVTAAAPDMAVLVAGRLLQGLGIGGQTVASYVLVARVYPPRLHGRVFAAMSAAWVIPAIVGPALTGAIAEYLHWRWVFAGVAVLTLLAFASVWLRLRGLPTGPGEAGGGAAPIGALAGRLVRAVLVAAAVLTLSLAGEAGVWMPAVVVVSLAVAAVAVRPLLPTGVLRVRRGLPSVVLMRALVAAAFFSAEIYVPYLLIDHYGFSATWAGLGLTTAALLWAAASDVQGRYGDRLGSTRIAVLACVLLGIAILVAAATALWHLHPAILIATWSLAGAGMGLIHPRLTVLTLAYSTPQNQGFNSSALSISDAVGSAASVAVIGLVFVALTGTGAAFPVVFLIAAGLAAAALLPGVRLGNGR